MRVIGIDPGYALVGYGVVDYVGNRFRTIDYGVIETPADMPFSQRLERIWDELSVILARHKPDEMGIEKLFFARNTSTALDVAQARGVLQLCGTKHDVAISEYAPVQIKQAVVGYGQADKNQVQQMTKSILGLTAIPKPDDAADALAVAICHAHSAGSYLNLARHQGRG